MDTAPANNPLTDAALQRIAHLASMPLTCCRWCDAPLTDPVSVDLGIGPVCRGKGQFKALWEAVAENLRPLAKAALRSISASEGDADEVVAQLSILRTLGFGNVADKVERKLAWVDVVYKDSEIEVQHGLDARLFAALARVPGWRRERRGNSKVHVLPASERPALIAALRSAAPGKFGWSNRKGLFQVRADGDWSLVCALSMEALEAAAAKLARSHNEAVRAEGARAAHLAGGATSDWTVPMPEHELALQG
jgi:hypothetical protein